MSDREMIKLREREIELLKERNEIEKRKIESYDRLVDAIRYVGERIR